MKTVKKDSKKTLPYIKCAFQDGMRAFPELLAVAITLEVLSDIAAVVGPALLAKIMEVASGDTAGMAALCAEA